MTNEYNKVFSGDENTNLLMEGLEIMESAVGSTLGPCGTNVILQTEFGAPHITKDGVSVAKAIKLEGVQGIGASLLKEVASKTEKTGDGTTSATVLAYNIAIQGLKYSKLFNPHGIKRGIERACEDVIRHLKENTEEVSNADEIYNVALVSTNHDEKLAGLFKQSYELAGKDGTIVVEKSKELETSCKRIEGLQFDRGYAHESFINDEELQECRFENPNIVFIDGVLDNLVELNAFFTKMGSTLFERPLVIVAEKFDDNILATFVINKVKNGARVLLVRAPGFGDRRQEWTTDLCAFTGATCVSANTGISLSDFDTKYFGTCDVWRSDFDKTTILGGKSNTEVMEKLQENIRGQAERAISQIDRERHLERLARLKDGVVTIKIGGATEVEVKELADRVDDALHAVKAAINGGICCGGATSLIRASLQCNNPYNTDSAEYTGYELLKKCCKCTLRKIVSNLADDNFSADYVVSNVVGQITKGDVEYGFDAKECTLRNNMMEAGIIDPTDVVVMSLKNAVSVAGLLLSSGSTVIKYKKESQ